MFVVWSEVVQRRSQGYDFDLMRMQCVALWLASCSNILAGYPWSQNFIYSFLFACFFFFAFFCSERAALADAEICGVVQVDF